MRRVVIVGAGPCGLVALKEMLEHGHNVMICEQEDRLGGVFASAVAYPNLHLTITNWAMAFSDFPDPLRLRYSTAEEYLQYLQAYTDHFNLEPHIQYRTKVTAAKLSSKGSWSLHVRRTLGEEVSEGNMEADALIVATGASQYPKAIPRELAGYNGRIIHSSQYDETFKRDVADKSLRVLVIGGGESGADIAAELGDLSPNVSVWLRRPLCVGPRYLNKRDELEQIQMNKTTDFPANGFLEAATTSRMSAGQNVLAYGIFRRILWQTPVLNNTLSRMCLDSTKSAFLRNDQATYVTKNQRMCEALHNGNIQIQLSRNISSTGRYCTFHRQDGTTETQQFDAIVLCTGYRVEFPWIQFSEGICLSSNPRSWFLHCFPPNLGHCLFFVGYTRPHQGGIPVMAEMLSRYIALLMTGARRLPVDYTAQAHIDAKAEREYYHLSPDLDTLVDYNAFLESVARRIGCEPRLPLLATALFNIHMATVILLVAQILIFDTTWSSVLSSVLLWVLSVIGFFILDNGVLLKWWFYPHWAVWYRQRGPGANPKLLKQMLARVNLWKSTAITRGFVLLVLWSVPAYYVQRLTTIMLLVTKAMLATFGIQVERYWGAQLLPKLYSLHDCPAHFSDIFLP
ncbi:uncharacterized protein PV06_10560 [Exophiala oligosperma]|uniref:FAD/NAD(P)-binding domain-containing protein n=1 Tax=Exophiala oligosperma TaxID=215243 RepID=A0A0D2D4E4_9EURO|nr:uncharacterized protein PV06_10560 [Exophiala oligosperma]KIW37210.1 hypothetical protein PV06_10560 [Exophiala oligosperma]